MGIINKLFFIRYRFKKIGNHYSVGRNVSVRNSKYISIGDNVILDDFTRLQCWPEYNGYKSNFDTELIIGDNVSFMRNCHVSCMNKIEIGNGCLFGDNVFITDNFHGDNSKEQLTVIPIERPLFSKGIVKIGNNVWVGRNVCILPGVEIGDGVVIGANSVVTHSFASGSVIGGVPAKKIY